MVTEVLIGIRMQTEAEDLIGFILGTNAEIAERARRLAGLAEEQRRQARQEKRHTRGR